MSFLEFLLILVSVALPLVIGVSLVDKTGHNRWLGLLVVVPLANIALLLYLLAGTWPIRRELAVRRLRDGNGNTEDGMIAYREAIRLLRTRRHEDAIQIFGLIESNFPDSQLAGDARLSRIEAEKTGARPA